MSLIDFVQKIQKKPRRVRIQFLWISVFICMFFIVSLWIFSLKHSLSIDEDSKKDDTVSSISNDMISLKDVFKASIGAFFEKDENIDLEQVEIESQDKIIEQAEELNEIKPARLPLSQ